MLTELLSNVDDWTGFPRHFVHLKLGRVERTLFILDWLQSVELRAACTSG